MKNVNARLFWKRLDIIREEQGLSLTEICAKTPELVYRTLTQQRTRNILPNVEILVLLARTLNVSMDYLISGKEHIDPLIKKLKDNPELGELINRISLCNKKQLQTLNILLDSWGIDKAVGESIGEERILRNFEVL